MAVLVERFKRWLDTASPGDEYSYHWGELGIDRYDDAAGEVPNELHVLAGEVYAAHEKGLVNLYQIPLDEHRLLIRGSEYIARKCQPKDRFNTDDAFRARMKALEWSRAVPVTPKYEDQCDIIKPKGL